MFYLNKILALGTIAGQIFLVVGLIYFYFQKNLTLIKVWLRRWGLSLAWLVATLATLISLYYSNVLGYAPCALCWWQRIFLYPLVIILLPVWKKENSSIIVQAKTLAIIGTVIALYHNYLDWGGTSPLPCATTASAVSCTVRYVFEFGYITIPLMSLTAFLLILFLLKISSLRAQ